jgi:large subunit ribosomal protein L15
MELHSLKYTKGSRGHKEKRGRGFGTGFGKTNGRGTKGQNSRKSGHVRLGFEGGQTPLYRKTPKIGFNNYQFANNYSVVTLKQLLLVNEELINKATLIKCNLISKTKAKLPVKVISSVNIDFNKAITLNVDKVSASVKKIIENAGGKIVEII